jgi:hypothetical protein
VDLSDVGIALLVAVGAAVPLGVTIWALLDAARRPQWAWALAGRRQVVWMAAIMFGTVSVIGGLVLSIWYLSNVRHQIEAAEEGHLPGAHRPGRAAD